MQSAPHLIGQKELRIYLQNRDTLEYLKDIDTWTPEVALAFEFKTVMEALTFCRQTQIPNGQIVLSFEGYKDVLMPVCENGGAA